MNGRRLHKELDAPNAGGGEGEMQTERTQGESFSKQSKKVFSLDLSNDTFTQSARLSLALSFSPLPTLSSSRCWLEPNRVRERPA